VNKKPSILFKRSQQGSTNSYQIVVQEAQTMDNIRQEIQVILKKPVEERNKLLAEFALRHPDLNTQEYTGEISQLIIAGFQEVFKQNQQLNQQLVNQQSLFYQEQKKLQEQLTQLNNRIIEMQRDKEERELRREKYRQRKKQETKQGIYLDHYRFCLEIIGDEETYHKAIFRLACAFLFITGARIGEILILQKTQVETLFDKQRPFLAFDRLKKGPTNKKAFLSPEGARIVKERRRDYEVLLKYSLPSNLFLFSSRKDVQDHFSRPYFTRQINEILDKVGKHFDMRCTSHSFRKGHITKLWQSTRDLELVKQIIGHVDVGTTQRYVEQLSEVEIAEVMQGLPDEKEEEDKVTKTKQYE
jgi:integrase